MSEAEGPQFDRAEFDDASKGAQCGVCSSPLVGFYYEANGQTVCEACKYLLEASLTAGSGATRAVRAIGAGVGAAVAGALLYYAITALTGYEFGLIAIVVGYGVGIAVRWGAHGRGGWKYQTLAIALTYMAIVATYIPPIIRELQTAAAQQEQTGQPDAAQTTAAADASPADAAAPVSLGFAVLVLLGIAIVAPFLAGFENILGLIIIGIGLYEAWKLNKRTELTITGPHSLTRPAAV